MKRSYNVDASFLVWAETRQEAMDKVKKLRTPRGVSLNWVIQARYTDPHDEVEQALNEEWTNIQPVHKDYDDEIDDLLDNKPSSPPIGPFMGPKLRPRKD